MVIDLNVEQAKKARKEAEKALGHLDRAIRLITIVRDQSPRKSEERTYARNIGVMLEEGERDIKKAIDLIGLE